jgi:hypothetical protein
VVVVVVGPHCHCHAAHYHQPHVHQPPKACMTSAELQQVIIDDVRKIVDELYNYAKLNLLERI